MLEDCIGWYFLLEEKLGVTIIVDLALVAEAKPIQIMFTDMRYFK